MKEKKESQDTRSGEEFPKEKEQENDLSHRPKKYHNVICGAGQNDLGNGFIKFLPEMLPLNCHRKWSHQIATGDGPIKLPPEMVPSD